MIIDSSYFLNKMVCIPNAVEQPSIGGNTPSAVSSLNAEIAYKEQELLISILGHVQYLELASQFVQVAGVWNWVASPLQKWVDFVDGKDDWMGLRYTIAGNKISLIANYVYCYYLEQDYSTYATTGVVIPDSSNSTHVNPTHKIVTAWNDFVKKLNGVNCNFADYPFTIQDRPWNFWNFHSKEMSLLDFMYFKSNDYDTSFFQIRVVKNQLGL